MVPASSPVSVSPASRALPALVSPHTAKLVASNTVLAVHCVSRPVTRPHARTNAANAGRDTWSRDRPAQASSSSSLTSTANTSMSVCVTCAPSALALSCVWRANDSAELPVARRALPCPVPRALVLASPPPIGTAPTEKPWDAYLNTAPEASSDLNSCWSTSAAARGLASAPARGVLENFACAMTYLVPRASHNA